MDYKIKEETLSGIADAIRSKSGSSEAIKVSEFAEQIETIPTGSDIDLIENLPIAVDFSQGNQLVEAPEGQAVKSAVIQKPTNLVPENIAEGINVAGITGTLEPFNVEILENIPINLDFSNGNQTIEAEEGYLVKSATVFKPETLIPENIANGINIAGIIGTFAGGTGGSGAKIATGTIDSAVTTGTKTITHDLGVTPDIIFFFDSNIGAVKNTIGFIVGVSSAFGAAVGHTFQQGWYRNSTASIVTHIRTDAIDSTVKNYASIFNANDTTFTINSSNTSSILKNSFWFAIGGLT